MAQENPAVALRAMCLKFRSKLTQMNRSDVVIIATYVPDAVTIRSQVSRPSSKSKLSHATTDPTMTDSPILLALETVRYFREHTDDNRRRSGLAEWRVWKEQWFGHPESAKKSWNMHYLANIFSKIFFLVPLRNPISFQWKEDIDGKGKRHFTFGDSRHNSKDEIKIRIDPNDHSIKTSLPGHSNALLSTFLHELTHVMLYSICCDGAGSHKDHYCQVGGSDVWPPKSGNFHCFGWFLIACYIDLCMEDLLEFQGHLFSFRSIVQDIKSGGTALAEDWKLFFSIFTWEEVQKLYGYLNADKGDNERQFLQRALEKHPDVMQVWAEEFERSQQG